MLWEHEPRVSVSTAFSSSPKLLQVLKHEESVFYFVIIIKFKADRLPMIVVAKKYICVGTVHQ